MSAETLSKMEEARLNWERAPIRSTLRNIAFITLTNECKELKDLEFVWLCARTDFERNRVLDRVVLISNSWEQSVKIVERLDAVKKIRASKATK